MNPAGVAAGPGPAGAVGLDGLSPAEVSERVARGEVNDVPDTASRTVGAILRANLLTRFNAILGVLLAVIVVVGPPQDALFAGVLVSNALIGIVQELRAKRTLDRLAVLSAPKARVRRGGRTVELAVGHIVLDDLVELGPGDQVVVDGVVVATHQLEVDQSLLTGEADPVAVQEGDEVLSGSFVVAGDGAVRTTRVGRDAYARALAEQARRFTLVQSELRAGVDRILRLVTWALVPTAILVVTSQLVTHHGLADALRASVAAVGGMIPEGLVLLTSVAFAVGVVRLGRRRVLVQELAAIEGLARVDVVCVDKTGTLTEGDIHLTEVELLPGGGDGPGGGADAATVLAALAAADARPNASMQAIARAAGSVDGWVAGARVPFSSSRKWSGADFGPHGAWVLGAPDVVLGDRGDDAARRRSRARSGTGSRVLVLARA
ncbi:MAG TPA: HAD-IC family P-type ATPase, partial [Acidimicrobiales bacterium]|nr:HAD-IC family P-type ATPase [Acidimicrobiales bacterium]